MPMDIAAAFREHTAPGYFKRIDAEYPLDCYPKRGLEGFISIKGDDGKWYPVVSESDKKAIKALQKSKEHDRFLVLPDATYSIAPEYLLYLSMVENGVINGSKVKYDYDKMHKMIQSIKPAGKKKSDS